jgi:hypothetical protein
MFFLLFYLKREVRLIPLGMLATVGPILPALDDGWAWSIWWNETWHDKPMYLEII